MPQQKGYQNPLQGLRRKTVSYAVAYTLAALLLVALLSLYPFSTHLKAAEEKTLLDIAHARKIAVEEYLARLYDAARLISSRPSLQQALAASAGGNSSPGR